jgi:hypothetical protein
MPNERVVAEHIGTVHHFILTIQLTEELSGTRIDWIMEFDTPDERARSMAYVPRCNQEMFDRLESELGLFP